MEVKEIASLIGTVADILSVVLFLFAWILLFYAVFVMPY